MFRNLNNIPKDPLEGISIIKFGKEYRNGIITSKKITESYLKRINAINEQLNAFIFLNSKVAIEQANAIDNLLASGIDLGPLMGVPVGVKDICAVDGMPTSNGSNIKTEDITGPEGTLIKRLKSLGCIILGKTHTVEFALGATGINKNKGTPKNPYDCEEHRIPGGSSSGSAVAVAAGLVPFAIGTDTGGSVRIPSALCGTVGLKTTKNLWPTDGIFPLSPTLDTVGPLCRSTEDAKIIFETITQNFSHSKKNINLSKIKIGKLCYPFTNNLDDEVSHAYEKICKKLIEFGAHVNEVNMPEAEERTKLFPKIVGAELISSLGNERFMKNVDKMDPITGSRAKIGLEVMGHEYILAKQRLEELKIEANKYFDQNDVLISPTTIMRAIKYEDSIPGGIFHKRSLLASANTQPVNLMGLCAISIPIQKFCTDYGLHSCLPVGLQLICPANQENKLLNITLQIERVIN